MTRVCGGQKPYESRIPLRTSGLLTFSHRNDSSERCAPSRPIRQTGQPVFFNCPVSGEVMPAQMEITRETPAVEVGGEVHILCTGGHIHALREGIIAAEGGTGGPSKPTGPVPSSWTTATAGSGIAPAGTGQVPMPRVSLGVP